MNQPERTLATFTPDFLNSRLEDLAKVLPRDVAAESFARICLTALNKSPEIRNCSRESILGCIFDLATINLVPNTPLGFAYLIPYAKSLTVQIGYKGFCELAYRTGHVKMIQADVVREGDTFEHRKGSDTFVCHSKSLERGRDSAPILAAWAKVEMLNGGENLEVITGEQLETIERLANSRKPSPAWKAFGDEMRRKTVVKRLLKLLQIGNMPEVAAAIQIDNKHSDIAFERAEPQSVPLLTFEDAPALTSGRNADLPQRADRQTEPVKSKEVATPSEPETLVEATVEPIDREGFIW